MVARPFGSFPAVPRLFSSALLLGLAALLAWGCGSDEAIPTPPRIAAFDVAPGHLEEPGEVTVSWVTEHATSLELRLGDEVVDLAGQPAEEGSLAVRIEESATFTLTARGSGGRTAAATREVEVDPLQPPSIAALDAPEWVELGAGGEATVLIAWEGVERAATLRLEADDRDPLALDPLAEGSVEVQITGTTTFTLIAENEAGSASLDATVRAARVPTIVAFEADRRLVGSGEAVTVEWATTGAALVELWQDEVRILEEGTPEGNQEVLVGFATTLELRAINEVGTEVSASLSIEVGPPEIVELDVGVTSLWLGETFELSWVTVGGSSLEIFLEPSGEPICEIEGLEGIDTSSCSWQPSEVGIYTAIFSLSNLSGVQREHIEIYVATGPTITLLTATPGELTGGDRLTIGWKVSPDPAGNPPSLRLHDDRGNTHPLPSEEEGAIDLTLEEAGIWELRLEATTDHPDAQPDLATIQVLVHPRSVVDLVASTELFDDTIHEDVVISWTAAHAETLVLYEIVEDAPVMLLEMEGSERESGSYRYLPTEARRFRLVATNAIGAEAMAEVAVGLAPTEVTSLTVEPSTFTQGQEVTVRWASRMADEVRINTSTVLYLREETNTPYLDLSTMEGTRVPLTGACGVVDRMGCAQIFFPESFSFPFDGVGQSWVWVHTEGYLSFAATAQPGNSLNQRFPLPTANHIALAPFWDSTAWDLPRYPAGNVFAALLEEEGEDIFVIQWKDLGYSNARTASFNFQVVLREDGSFDFRYGEQAARDSGISVSDLNGGSATIGFQLPNQSDHDVLLFNGAGSINGLRDHRSFSYRPLPTLPLQGELVFRPLGPSGTFPITITATRGEASHSLSETVTVARKPILELTPETIAPVALGEDIRIGWRITNAHLVEVLDEVEELRCSITDPDAIEEGLCVLREDAGGHYEYTLRVSGANGAVVERKIPVRVFGDFGVAALTTPTPSVERGSDVLLEWLTFATRSVTLYAGDDEIFSDASGALEGSFLVPGLEEETVFRLIATNDVGATDEATLTVGIWPVTFNLQASSTRVRPGDEVTISIDARALDGGAPQRVWGMLPLIDVPGPADRFEDISEHPTARQLADREWVDLPFPFPYLGAEQTGLVITNFGYITFSTTNVFSQSNQKLPNSSLAAQPITLAPFWDGLHPRNVGRMHAAQPNADTFVVQWKNYSLTSGSNDANPHDLNFQIVLHRNGTFDFRYGTMAPHPTYRPTSGCFPNTCVNEVNGSAATIGYQQIGGLVGHNFHFGGISPAEGNPPVEGGLSNRTIRYAAAQGIEVYTFRLQEAETFSYCIDVGAETYCREVEVEVPFGFTNLTLSKEQIAPGESVTISWQTAGGKSLRIFGGDELVYETSDLDQIDAGSTTVTPSQNTVYRFELQAGLRTETTQRVVEVERFTLTSSITPSVGPGSPVTLSWILNAPGGGAADIHVLAPMVEISNEDYDLYDLATDPQATQLLGANARTNRVVLNFEDGFTFPYFGTEYSWISVYAAGYLGWAQTGNGNLNNQRFPASVTTQADVAIAPFWEDLHSRQSGRVYAKRIDADRYVIQWSHMSLNFGSSNDNEGNLNFMVVLHRDGTFEYRFGIMDPPPQPATSTSQCNPVSCERESNGSSATIGYQLRGGLAGYTLHFGGTNRGADQPIVPGGLAHRAWRFTPSESSGSRILHPGDTTAYRLCAYESATQEVSCAPTVAVSIPWGIDLFQANPATPLAGQQVTLGWSAQNLDSLRLLADGVQLASYTAPTIPLLGSFDHTPGAAEVTYTLEGTSMKRTVSREVVVRTRTFDLEVDVPSGVFTPGQTVEVSWRLTQHTPGTPVMVTPLSEVELGPNGENAFVDISQLSGAQRLLGDGQSGNYADVTIPFSFPYLGNSFESLRVFPAGYVSFGTSTQPRMSNKVLPIAESSAWGVNLAVFWDDLVLRGGDSIWSHSPDPDTLIVQWEGISRKQGSSENVRYDLNFQVVLRSDGSFDFRYGDMAPPAPPFSDPACYPDTCWNEANGSSATIGYQDFSETLGYTFHIGSLGNATQAAEEIGAEGSGGGDGFLTFPGGLSNRTFRYSPAPTGSARIVVGRTSDQQLCAILADFQDCRPWRFHTVANAGELIFTELMADPSDGAPAQWFEIRNVSTRTIDLEGFELRTRGASHTITGSLPLAPGEFATFAASSLVPFTADYVYGGDLPLDRAFERLELYAGEALISSMSWGIDWSIPRDQTLALDPSLHLAGVQVQPEFSSWCHGGPLGSPGTLGEGCLSEWYDIDPAANLPFIDISTTGARLWELEYESGNLRLPSPGFPIRAFGESFSRVWAGAYGWLSLSDFDPISTSFPAPPNSLPRTQPLANVLPGPLVAGFWDILRCRSCRAYSEVREIEGQKVLIVQWEDFWIAGNVSSSVGIEGSITFQTQVWENGDFVHAFGAVHNPYFMGSDPWAQYEGAHAVVYLEGRDPSDHSVAHFKRPLGFHQRTIHFRAK